MLGREKRQCLRIELKTRKCHAKGTFLRFMRTRTAATILEVLPGPVKVFMRSFCRFAREALNRTTIGIVVMDVSTIDFKGSLVAEAMATLMRD